MTNIFNDPFSAIHNAGECLLGVYGRFFVDENGDNMLVAIRFHFENNVVVFEVNDDDSFKVFGSLLKNVEEEMVFRDLSRLPPWNYAVGKPLLWTWRMINQQGYFDGFQIQFGTVDINSTIQIQLMIAASEIKIKVT